ncbi:ATP-binding cassette sub-family G member 4-like isoform X1 [Vespa velutina]|uniref:ATP-binding cassette sub-family G member 4-like isoform X1 n=1 Tax=Vespa velutina TaxID=202808 RepID=UPI001FB41606|nr:ATP-binding cassette sub-family G member 4-like isoform X1 [Vespa velutina]
MDAKRNDDDKVYQIDNDHEIVDPMMDHSQNPNESQDSWLKRNAPCFYIEFENLSYSVPIGKEKQKKILQNATGCFEPGKLTAVVGPSGAGKSTLLSIISGVKSSNVKGSIKINNREKIDRNIYRKQICYIPQEFMLHPLLTTKETLYIAARLKLGRGYSTIKSHFIVNNIAKSLGLMNCLNTTAGKLSGGEKKRLLIGVEIVTKPTVLLLDEPTSGLDSVSSNQVINLLHSMSKSGCTVACAVHQPSSQMISEFDNIIVIDQGRTLYCGPRENVLDSFKEAGYISPHFYNVVEFVLEVVTNQCDDNLKNLAKMNSIKYVQWRSQCEYYKNETVDTNGPLERLEMDEESDLANEKFRKLSIWEQQKILLLRSFICIKRDNIMTKLRFIAHVIVGILLGSIFYDFGNDANKVTSNISCIFFFLLFLFFANSLPVVQIFPTEASVFYREHLNNWYSLMPYYISKIVSDLPIQLLCPTSFFIIAYYMTGQPMERNSLSQAWIVCILHTIIGQSVGITVGAIFDTQIGIFLIPALSIPMFLFAGFFLKLNEISSYYQPLCTISFFRYAFEGIMQAIYGFDRKPLSCTEIYCPYRSPNEILSMMNMQSVKFHVIVVVMLAWIFSLHVITYCTLRWKVHKIRK